MAERDDWPNHDWYGRTDGPSEFSWGPGLTPPGKENAPPSDGGMYRGKCPPVEFTRPSFSSLPRCFRTVSWARPSAFAIVPVDCPVFVS